MAAFIFNLRCCVANYLILIKSLMKRFTSGPRVVIVSPDVLFLSPRVTRCR